MPTSVEPKSCSRCGNRTRLIRCYWDGKYVCPTCVRELNVEFDVDGWPEEGRLDQPDGGNLGSPAG